MSRLPTTPMAWLVAHEHFYIHKTGYLKIQIHPRLFHKISQMNNNNPNNLWQDSTYR